MAAGGGGMRFRTIGGAAVLLKMDDRQYWSKLAAANIGLQKFATASRQAMTGVGFAPLAASIGQMNAQLNQTRTTIAGVVRDFRTMNRVIQSTTVNAMALARAINSIGKVNVGSVGTMFSRMFAGAGRGVGNIFQGLGSGLSSVARGFGSGLGSAIRGTAPVIRATGSAFAAVARGFGSLLSQTMRGFGSLVSSVVRSIGSLIRMPRNLLGGLGGIGLSIGGLGAIAGGVGGAFSIAYIISQVRAMESTLVALRRTAGGSQADIARMAASFNNMGVTLAGVDLNKIFDLAIMGSRLGVPREQLDLFTRDLAKTSAVLEDIPIDEAATRMSGLIDVFRLQYTDTIRLASALNALDIASNATGRDILDITGRLSGAASTLGLTVQQTLALSTAMRQARVPIETAGTAMSQILGRMTGASLPQFARVAGMSIGRFRQVLQTDALQALVAVERGLGRLAPLERFRALDQLRLDGQRVRLVMLQLIPILPRLTQYLGIANDEWQSTNSIMRGFAMQAETADAMFTRMWNNIQLTAVALGRFFLPVLKGAADGIGNLAADIRTFIEGNGDRLEAWGKRVGGVFLDMGAAMRVDWADIGTILSTSMNDFWGQLKENSKIGFANMIKIGSNAIDQLAMYIAQALPLAIQSAALTAFEKVASIIPARMAAMMGLPNPAIFAAIRNNLPAIRPAGDFLNRNNLLQGAINLPGFQMPDMMRMIPGLFGNQVAGQQRDANRRMALGNMQDWITRQIARIRGGRAADPALARQAGLAQMEDQAGGGGIGGMLGGMGGGMGGGGGGDVGAGGADFGMMGGPGGGMDGAPGADAVGMNRMAIGMMALGMGGMVGPMLARARRARLMAWRQRQAARRGPQAFNPWIGIRNNLVSQRQAMWEVLGGGQRAHSPEDRLEMLRRVQVNQRAAQEARDARAAAVGPQLPQWAHTLFGRVDDIVDALGAIRRELPIPKFQ